MVQVLSDKTTTSLKASAIVAFSVHIVLLDCSRKYPRYLIDYGHTFVGFLPVPTAEQNGNSNIDDDVKIGSVCGSYSNVSLEDEMPFTY